MCSPFWCSSYVTVNRESKANAATRDEIAERSQIQTGNTGAAAVGAAGFAAPLGKDDCAADGLSPERYVFGCDGRKADSDCTGLCGAKIDQVGGALCSTSVAEGSTHAGGVWPGRRGKAACGFFGGFQAITTS